MYILTWKNHIFIKLCLPFVLPLSIGTNIVSTVSQLIHSNHYIPKFLSQFLSFYI